MLTLIALEMINSNHLAAQLRNGDQPWPPEERRCCQSGHLSSTARGFCFYRRASLSRFSLRLSMNMLIEVGIVLDVLVRLNWDKNQSNKSFTFLQIPCISQGRLIQHISQGKLGNATSLRPVLSQLWLGFPITLLFANTVNNGNLSHKASQGFSEILSSFLLLSEVYGLRGVGGRIWCVGYKYDQIIRFGFLFKFNSLKETFRCGRNKRYKAD